jgi:hypothetical protein
MLHRDDWLDLARKVDWTFKYVDEREVFPEHLSGSPRFPHQVGRVEPRHSARRIGTTSGTNGQGRLGPRCPGRAQQGAPPRGARPGLGATGQVP